MAPDRESIVWWHAPLALVVVTALNGLIAVSNGHGHTGRLFGYLMLGPFSAWLIAPLQGHIPLGPIAACFGTVLPLCIYAARGTIAGLVVGATFWFLAGWGFCVAVWV